MEVINRPICLLNTSILTATGDFRLEDISLEIAKALIAAEEYTSAIGHQSTAEILTELLETTVPLNRINFEQQLGQKALVFKLHGRPEEGKILNREDIEAIGYKFQLLTKIK